MKKARKGVSGTSQKNPTETNIVDTAGRTSGVGEARRPTKCMTMDAAADDVVDQEQQVVYSLLALSIVSDSSTASKQLPYSHQIEAGHWHCGPFVG